MKAGILFLVAILPFSTSARGPVCFNCLAVRSPEECQTVTECQPTENCFAEHFLFNEEIPAYGFGCRKTQECESDVKKRFELKFCQECCTGDLCNNNICTNATALPSGLPCLDCRHASSTERCSRITYCEQGEVCYAEQSSTPHEVKFQFGCLKKPVCSYFSAEIIGRRRSVTDFTPCHKCCEEPGCNYEGCSHHDQTTTTAPEIKAKDCWDLKTLKHISENGVYEVFTPDGETRKVRCDMETNGGGWTVFQRRGDGTVSFNQNYEEYSSGFGNLSGEFWMGNDFLYEITHAIDQTLRVDICDWTGETRWAEYSVFSVGPASDKYRLMVEDYNGTAGDTLITVLSSEYNQSHNGSRFSAPDDDNDIFAGNCAKMWSSGWWFEDCFAANLNGLYRAAANTFEGIQWFTWIQKHSFKGTEMKIRPHVATPSTHEPFRCPVI